MSSECKMDLERAISILESLKKDISKNMDEKYSEHNDKSMILNGIIDTICNLNSTNMDKSSIHNVLDHLVIPYNKITSSYSEIWLEYYYYVYCVLCFGVHETSREILRGKIDLFNESLLCYHYGEYPYVLDPDLDVNINQDVSSCRQLHITAICIKARSIQKRRRARAKNRINTIIAFLYRLPYDMILIIASYV